MSVAKSSTSFYIAANSFPMVLIIIVGFLDDDDLALVIFLLTLSQFFKAAVRGGGLVCRVDVAPRL